MTGVELAYQNNQLIALRMFLFCNRFKLLTGHFSLSSKTCLHSFPYAVLPVLDF
jgi:hypothetical protein